MFIKTSIMQANSSLLSACLAILAEGAIALSVTLSGGALFASWKLLQFPSSLIVKVILAIFMGASAQHNRQVYEMRILWTKLEEGLGIENRQRQTMPLYYVYLDCDTQLCLVGAQKAPQKLKKSHWCVPFTATFSKRRWIGALWSERCDASYALIFKINV